MISRLTRFSNALKDALPPKGPDLASRVVRFYVGATSAACLSGGIVAGDYWAKSKKTSLQNPSERAMSLWAVVAAGCVAGGASFVYFPATVYLYRNNLKNRDFGAERQGPSESANSETNPVRSKPDSSGCFGIMSRPRDCQTISPLSPATKN